jgi:structural maintenance of chromosome 1
MVQKLQRHFTGVHGRVVDLCKPSATKFDVAVMTVLGRNIDSIIVDHEKTAIRCIQFLRQQRAFQATFLPLDTLQATHVPERLKHLEKARPAIECINYDAELDTAMQYVCGTAMVCDTIAVAKDICYQKNLEVKGELQRTVR